MPYLPDALLCEYSGDVEMFRYYMIVDFQGNRSKMHLTNKQLFNLNSTQSNRCLTMLNRLALASILFSINFGVSFFAFFNFFCFSDIPTLFNVAKEKGILKSIFYIIKCWGCPFLCINFARAVRPCVIRPRILIRKSARPCIIRSHLVGIWSR